MGTAQNGGALAIPALTSDVMDGRRTLNAMGANLRHVRHAQLLERWPILPEGWARAIESSRLAAVDRTPGAASFGR